MRVSGTPTLLAIVAIVCCLGAPIVLSTGAATVLLAAGVSLPTALLVAGMVWLWHPGRRPQQGARNAPPLEDRARTWVKP